MEWQPIETAPKDGRLLVVKSDSPMGKMYDPRRAYTAWWAEAASFCSASWARETKVSEPSPNYVCYPTHWLCEVPT